MSRADNFSIFREFRYLQMRILLNLQDQLRELERHLWKLDRKDNETADSIFKLQSRESDDKECGERACLMEEIQTKWKEYGKVPD